MLVIAPSIAIWTHPLVSKSTSAMMPTKINAPEIEPGMPRHRCGCVI
jgi:hypothetical protein